MKVMNLPPAILKSGMTNYEDICNSSGAVILVKDTVLEQWQIDRIHLNNIDKVKIKLTENDGLYAEKGKDEITSIYNSEKIKSFGVKYETKVDEVTHIIKEIGRGAAVDVHGVSQLSRHIIKEFSTISDVINYLHLV